MLTYTDFFNCINDALNAAFPDAGFVVYGSSRKDAKFPVITSYSVIADSNPLNLSFRFVKQVNTSQVDENTAWRMVTAEFIASLLNASRAGKLTQKEDIIY